MEVIIANVDFKKTGFNQAFLENKAFSILGNNNSYYKYLESLFDKIAPEKNQLFGKEDFVLTNNQQVNLKAGIENLLLDLIKEKPNMPENELGTQVVMGKNVEISLRDPEDKLIAMFIKLLDITEDCLKNNIPMFFSVVKR